MNPTTFPCSLASWKPSPPPRASTKIRRSTALLLAAAILAPTPALAVEKHDPIAEAWALLDAFSPKEAHALFRKQEGAEARFGEAISLLQLQPRTSNNVARATTLLRDLAADTSAAEWRPAALYHLGRIAQLHSFAPDETEAARVFESLMREHPDSPYAGRASVLWMLSKIYHAPTPADADAALAEAEALFAGFVARDTRRDFGIRLAEAYVRLRDDHAKALAVYAAVIDDDFMQRSSMRSRIYLQAAYSARQAGRPGVAIGYLQRFLDEFPRDARSPEVARRLEALRKEEGGA